MTSFCQFQNQFPDDEACLRHIMKVRYGGTEIDCPKCGQHAKFYRMTRERAFVCQRCKYQLHPTVGTPMHRTHLPLHKWFYAMFLFTASRHGVSAKELQRQLAISYKSAWRMAHEIRKFMAAVDGDGTLDGIVGLDEAYIGGRKRGEKAKGLTGRGAGKAIFFGMIERAGEVITRVVERSVRGTHVWVSPKHLSEYLGEFEFRYNRRKRPASMFAELVASL